MTEILNQTYAKLAELRFRWIKYPKLTLLILTFVSAYFLYHFGKFSILGEYIIKLGYLAPLFAGIFFAYGFTTAPSAAIFIAISENYNLWLASLTGGLGIVFGNLVIFYFVRYSLNKEIIQLKKEKIFRLVEKVVLIIVPQWFRRLIVPFAIGFIIASPLPDEVSAVILSSQKKISPLIFILITFILGSLGVFILLSIGRI